jgi:hypothetical protein
MSGFVDRTVVDIDGRLEDLKTEMTKLRPHGWCWRAAGPAARRRPSRSVAHEQGGTAPGHAGDGVRRAAIRRSRSCANIRESRSRRSPRRWVPNPITCIG